MNRTAFKVTLADGADKVSLSVILAPIGHSGAKMIGAMTYAEFWPRYLAAHADKRTRALHYLGTGAGLLMLVAFIVTRAWWWLVAAPVVGYACAWTGHAVFEHNKPETFGHPFWSLYSDFRMLTLFLAGRLEK